MKLKEDMTEEKLRGAYYTPLNLATNIVEKILDFSTIKNILEPSCGDGVFIEAIRNSEENASKKIKAIEIDKDAFNELSKKYKKDKYSALLNKDFFDYYENNKSVKFDLVIGNPPYIRYQYLEPNQRDELSKILTDNGLKSNKLINAWVGFTVACSKLVANKGSLVFILPAELLQVVYAKDLRNFLLREFNDISIFTFSSLVFDGIEQETVVLKCTHSSEHKGIRIIELSDADDLRDISLDDYKYIDAPCTQEKWTKYFTNADEVNLINEIKNDNRFHRLDDVALVNVGITTGNNKYFCVEKSIIKKYRLNNYVMPLIGRSAHVDGAIFTNEDYLLNYNKDKKANLLVLNQENNRYPNGLKEYIKLGEDQEVNKGYKCSIRDNWYEVPSVWIPDAFFLRRNNIFPKFVMNNIQAVSTDTMHRVKFNDGIDGENILLSYYNSISFAFTEINGRSYGGGVLEILPSEVGSIMLPIINGIPEDIKETMLSYIDLSLRNSTDIEIILDEVDRVVLVEYLGIQEETCTRFRQIWRKLNNRRLGRAR